jgi:hypothetical protein
MDIAKGKVQYIQVPRPNIPSSSFDSRSETTTLNSFSDDDGEQFAVPTQEEYEIRTTADEAEKAMRDLLGGAVGSIDISDVDMKDAVVEGFADNIRLMPHQIQGRIWMRERETGRKAGGILADVSTSNLA